MGPVAFLQVKIAEWSRHGVHYLADGSRGPRVAHVEDVVKSGERRLGLVGPRDVTVVAGIEVSQAGRGVQGLPIMTCQYGRRTCRCLHITYCHLP
jgi:hypothetical protein